MKGLRVSGALTAGIALVLTVNALTLGAAAWNRAGVPRTVLELTERELPLPLFREPEDTGVKLRLVSSDQAPRGASEASWLRRRKRIEPIRHDWFDAAKLRELGFRDDVDPSSPDAAASYDWLPRRYAYVVLEYDGPAFAAWLRGQEAHVEAIRGEVGRGSTSRQDLADAETLLELDRVARSRLFPVDAGLDADELLRRYPEPARHLIVRGVVAAHVVRVADGLPAVRGFIARILVDQVHVPKAFHPQFEPHLSTTIESEFYDRAHRTGSVDWPPAMPSRYRATLAVGRRFEPWLRSVTSEPTAAAHPDS
jgi:hypothetical protein